MAGESQFVATISEWCNAQEDRLTRVFRQSAQRVASLAQYGGPGASPRGVPVDVGFARASVRASLTSMPQINPAMQNKAHTPTPETFGEIVAIISNAKLGEHVYIGYTAAYANALEYGHSQQAPDGFVRLACAQWQQIVDQVAAEAQVEAGYERTG